MSDEIDTTAGVSSFVSARMDAWHRLGNVLNHSFTAEEAMTEGHLGGWNVRKIPAFAVDPETGLHIPMVGRNAVIRDNPIIPNQVDFLGDVGDDYHIVQNEEHAALLNALVDESGAHFETAGSLLGGKKVFITMKLPGHIKIGGVDPVENYIAAINSMDGSMAFTLIVTPVRIVCKNTLNAAFSQNSHMLRVRHTAGAGKEVVTRARTALDLTFDYLEGFQRTAEQMIQTTLTQRQFEEIMQREFGPDEDTAPNVASRRENQIDEIVELFCDAETHEDVRDTVWAGFNALAEWSDHFSPVRATDKEAARARKSIMDSGFKNRALKLMMAVV